MTSTTYRFGDRVAFTRSLHRASRSRRNGDVYRSYKEWTTERWIGDDNTTHPEPTRIGIVIGKRTLANGYMHYDYEDGTTFKPEEHLTAYLVAFDLHRSPVYVLPEHLTPTTIKETPR